MGRPLSHKEIKEFLLKIHQGEITVVPEVDPQRIYAGNVLYHASNGWRVVLFNDCNEWDYVDSVQKGGHDVHLVWSEDDLGYRISDEEAWQIWRIPGYLSFRCHVCGELIEPSEGRRSENLKDWRTCRLCSPADILKDRRAPLPKVWRLSDKAEKLLQQERDFRARQE